MPALTRTFFCCWEIFVSAFFSQLMFFAILALSEHEIHFNNDLIYHQSGEIVH
jgi:hypothetical protein